MLQACFSSGQPVCKQAHPTCEAPVGVIRPWAAVASRHALFCFPFCDM